MGRGKGRGASRGDSVGSADELVQTDGADKGEWLEERGHGVWLEREHEEELLRPRKRSLRRITPEEVAEHDTPDDMWVIIKDRVYNVTPFRLKHPGGRLPLENMAGKDATDPFMNYHPAYVYADLNRYVIGVLDDGGLKLDEVSPLMADFRALRQRLIEDGWFETSYFFYFQQLLWLASWFSAGVYLTLHGEETWHRMAGALCMGIFWQQLAFPGHDTGHNAITHIRIVDNLIGILVGNFFGGVSIGWWKWSHNVHHIVCNSVEHDPDIQHLPVFAVTSKIFQRFWSTFHGKWMEMDGAAKALVRYQHYLYYPVMCVARFNLYVQSFKLLLSDEVFPFKRLEVFAMLGFWGWLLSLLSTLPTWGETIGWLLVSHGFTGLLHVQITLSHFSMDTYHGHHGHVHGSDEDCWFRMQLATSLDVKSNFFTEWVHGGLQYQVLHHLFPRLPRHNLKKVQPLIQELCDKHGVVYNIMSFWDANKHVFAQLKKAASESEDIVPGEAVPHMVWDGWNARG